jgi:hypothetical protein
MLFDEVYKKILNDHTDLFLERCIPPLEVITKYKDDDNAFISFTGMVKPNSDRVSQVKKHTTKLGINPKSPWDTPIGIYSYPIKAFWHKLEANEIPYAENSPYLYILKSKNYNKLLIASKYSEEDYQRDRMQLQRLYPDIDIRYVENDINNSYFKIPPQKFWSLTRQMAIELISSGKTSKISVLWTKILMKFYDGVVDDLGQGFIHQNEPYQAVIWTSSLLRTVDFIDRTCGGKRTNYSQYWGDESDVDDNNLIRMVFYYYKTGKIVNPKYDDLITYKAGRPQTALRYVEEMGGNNIPLRVIEQIFKDKDTLFDYFTFMVANNKEIPPNIYLKMIQVFANTDNYSPLRFAMIAAQYDIEIPSIIYDKIKADSTMFYNYIMDLVDTRIDIPENVKDEFEKNILTKHEYALAYIKRMYIQNRHIPDSFYKTSLNAISKNPEASYKFLTLSITRGDELVEPLLNKITSNDDYLYSHILNIKDEKRDLYDYINNNVLNAFANNPELSARVIVKLMYDYELDVQKPDKFTETLINALKKNPMSCYSYVHALYDNYLQSLITQELIDIIAQDPEASEKYILNIELDVGDDLDLNNIKKNVINNEDIMASYARAILYDTSYKFQPEMLPYVEKNLLNEKEELVYYLRYLINHRQKISQEMWDALDEKLSDGDLIKIIYNFPPDHPNFLNIPLKFQERVKKVLNKNPINISQYIDRRFIKFQGTIPEFLHDTIIDFLSNDPWESAQFYTTVMRYGEGDGSIPSDIKNAIYKGVEKDPNQSLAFLKLHGIDKTPPIQKILRRVLSIDFTREKFMGYIDKNYDDNKKKEVVEMINNIMEIAKESFLFDTILQEINESYSYEEMDMDKAYELFNNEYLKSTGKSWSKEKFLSRARNWEFWGDDDGFIATRRQNSGFIKFVGSAGKDKSKYKGFKEMAEQNLPVWGMVDEKIATLLKKLGYRGPNVMEKVALKLLIKSGKMDSVLGGATINSIKGDKISLTYHDVGTVEKYFVASPEYWKKARHIFSLKNEQI